MLVFRSRFLNLLRSNQSRRLVLERRGRRKRKREKVAQKFMLLFLLLPTLSFLPNCTQDLDGDGDVGEFGDNDDM